MAKPRISLVAAISEDGKVSVLYIGGDAVEAQKEFENSNLGKDAAEIQFFKFLQPLRRKATGVEISAEKSPEREAAKAAAAKDIASEGPRAQAARLSGLAVEAKNLAMRARAIAKAAKDANVPDYEELEVAANKAESASKKAQEKATTTAKAAKEAKKPAPEKQEEKQEENPA